MNETLAATLLSLRIAIFATLLSALVALPLAFFMARNRFVGKSVIEAFMTIPLVIPPTVVGFGLIVLLGRRSFIGGMIESVLGTGLLFSTSGAVLAAALVSFPLLYLPAKGAFASIERELEDIALLMGASRLQILWHVSLPLARRGIVGGMMLAFARALGEFGATMMVLGNQQSRQTLPILVYDLAFDSGSLSRAAPAILILSAICLAVTLAYNRSVLFAQD